MERWSRKTQLQTGLGVFIDQLTYYAELEQIYGVRLYLNIHSLPIMLEKQHLQKEYKFHVALSARSAKAGAQLAPPA